jgi:Zn-dependent M28 family amino/carboxypeptidase
MHRLLAFVAALPALLPQLADPAAKVSEARLRTDLAYLASDELGGRRTPSKGLDAAAEYIASAFKEAGLQPVNDSYFQLAPGHPLNKEGEPTVKNVVGLLPGTDPDLKDTFLLVTAHYDHVGVNANAPGDDKVFNGANDNGSGTVSVIEIARALRGAQTRRSVLFVCFFGEERGLHGSNFYGQNPLVPIEKTIGMLNIEMVGRTDKVATDPSKRGAAEDWTGRLAVTGYDFSDMGARLTASGKKSGIDVVMDPFANVQFFMRSDNRSLAAAGVPAHTVSVGFIDSHYHQANDHADTIDYKNMANVVRALVNATLDLANDPVEPKWSPDNVYAKPYRDAWQKMHGGSGR